jgi:hypothetical protein
MMDDKREAIGGMIRSAKRDVRRIVASMSLRPPNTSHELTQPRTRAAEAMCLS